MKIGAFSKGFRKMLKRSDFYENPSSGSILVPCGWADGRRDKTKLTVVSRNFANTPINDIRMKCQNYEQVRKYCYGVAEVPLSLDYCSEILNL
jgi:hypothetical protein